MSDMDKAPAYMSNEQASAWAAGYEEANDAEQRTIRELEAERDALIADVREWACEKCNFVYPGPPQPGVRCVVCPRCGGSTMPHTTLRRRRAEAERDALREALTDAIECVEHWGDYANQYFKEKHDLAGDVARLRAALPPAPEAT